MKPERKSSKPPEKTAESDPRLGLIKRLGWTLTKSSYLRAMCSPEEPKFPLSPDLVSMIPENIPGKLPEDEFECWEISVDSK